jgi:hypothetical protein
MPQKEIAEMGTPSLLRAVHGEDVGKDGEVLEITNRHLMDWSRADREGATIGTTMVEYAELCRTYLMEQDPVGTHPELVPVLVAA